MHSCSPLAWSTTTSSAALGELWCGGWDRACVKSRLAELLNLLHRILYRQHPQPQHAHGVCARGEAVLRLVRRAPASARGYRRPSASLPTSNSLAPGPASRPSSSIWPPFASCSTISPPAGFWTSTLPLRYGAQVCGQTGQDSCAVVGGDAQAARLN